MNTILFSFTKLSQIKRKLSNDIFLRTLSKILVEAKLLYLTSGKLYDLISLSNDITT